MEQDWEKKQAPNGETIFISKKYKITTDGFARFQILPTPFQNEQCIILHCFPCSGASIQIMASHLPHLLDEPQKYKNPNEMMYAILDELCSKNCFTESEEPQIYSMQYKPALLINIHSMLNHDSSEVKVKPLIANFLESFGDKYLIVGFYEDLSFAFNLNEKTPSMDKCWQEIIELFDYVITNNFTDRASNPRYKYESKLSLHNVGLLGAIEGHFLTNYQIMIVWKDSVAFGGVEKDFNFFKAANLKSYHTNELQTAARFLL